MLRPESAAESAFRAEVRAWLAAHVPPDLRHQTFRPPPSEVMPWYRALSRRGWIAPHWPTSHGGMGASPVQQVILLEEMARAGSPDYPTQGLNHIGPLLIARGSPEQQRRHLPPILAGDVIWCQGYSEPGAGSDLASLRTRAERRGDTLVINGHKTWTTWGHHADWMFALVRTRADGKPRQGITFVLIDMATPGIRRRPIRTIAGDEEFAEVFLDDVVVPLGNVVGEVDGGWEVATAVLADERLRIGAPGQALRARERLRMMLRAASPGPDGAADPALREAVASADVELETLIAAYLEAAHALASGSTADSAYLKLLGTQTVHRLLELTRRAAGPAAALREPRRHGEDLLDATEMHLQARRLGIYGGSSEVQRGLIATRVLGLPLADGRARGPAVPDAPRAEALAPIADSAVDVMRTHAGPARARRVHEGAPVTDASTWRLFAELGWLGITVPEACGGLALGAPAAAVIAEAGGRALLTAPLGAAWAAGSLLARAASAGACDDGASGPGDAWTAATALDALLTGTGPVVPAAGHSEADGSLRVPLVPDGAVAAAWIVHGRAADGSTSLRWLRVDAPGVARMDRAAVDGSTLSDLRISPAAWADAPPLLRGPAADRAWTEARSLQWLADAALLAGIADAALRLALDYLGMRRQFGVPIGSFQALQHRAADLHVDLSATRALVHEAARVHGTAKGAWAAAAAMHRAAAVAQRIAQEGVQFHGAIGFADEHDAGLVLRRAMTVGARHGREILEALQPLPDGF